MTANNKGGKNMIFAYNKAHVGDTLMVIAADDKGTKNTVIRKGNVAQIKDATGQIVGWNFFHISDKLTIQGNGQVKLTKVQIAQLNQLIKEVGFEETLVEENEPKIVVGYVKTCVAHPDSDHLSITETQVSDTEVLQIVCGAPNIEAGQKVVVAKPGAMMPDGTMIWPGTLRGVESYGMICSAKELQLPDALKKKGILVLPEDAVIGKAFFK
ncbi:tRNA-binding protein [Enterococcus ratti]|uniref:tRNA-binding protein n=2 Tax=Enterococcus ratti TaxID=150033 RepID=A0A1L8WQP4_9ENTE|nr:tRNA-binding protein [Enterococcus ratti]